MVLEVIYFPELTL